MISEFIDQVCCYEEVDDYLTSPAFFEIVKNATYHPANDC